jgi:hypothetical protein
MIVTIRQARIEDAPILAEAERIIANEPGLLCSQPSELEDGAFAHTISELAAGKTGVYLVAEHRDRIVGHAFLKSLRLKSLRHVALLHIVVHHVQEFTASYESVVPPSSPAAERFGELYNRLFLLSYSDILKQTPAIVKRASIAQQLLNQRFGAPL